MSDLNEPNNVNNLCIDPITGQHFRVNIEYLHRLENGVRGLNDRLKNEMQITLNEWFLRHRIIKK